MTKEEFIDSIKNINGVEISEDEYLNIIFTNGISLNDIQPTLCKIYDYENELEKVNVMLNIRGLDTESLVEAYRYILHREDLKDPLSILNVINLIKIYNTLDDSFFDDKNNFIEDIEKFLDIKVELVEDINEFIKQLSIYFISLFKSYNKMVYTPLDNHKKLPNIYKYIFLSTDLLTLSGIFSTTKSFNIDECIYIDDALLYLTDILVKSNMSIEMMNKLFEVKE